MMKRIEVYVDAALLSFVLSVAAVLVLSVLGRLLAMLTGGGQSVMVPMMIAIVVLSIAIGAGLAIWIARVLHGRTVHDTMTAGDSRKVVLIAVTVAVAAPLLAGAYLAFGTTTPIVWLSVALLLMVLATALVVDAARDIVKPREHVGIDVVRVVLIGLLAASLVISMIQPAPLGSDQDVSPWVVWVTIALLVESLLAFGFDRFVSRGSRERHSRSSGLPAG